MYIYIYIHIYTHNRACNIHVHKHPQDKTIGKYWCVDFEQFSTYKTPGMLWGSGSTGLELVAWGFGFKLWV